MFALLPLPTCLISNKDSLRLEKPLNSPESIINPPLHALNHVSQCHSAGLQVLGDTQLRGWHSSPCVPSWCVDSRQSHPNNSNFLPSLQVLVYQCFYVQFSLQKYRLKYRLVYNCKVSAEVWASLFLTLLFFWFFFFFLSILRTHTDKEQAPAAVLVSCSLLSCTTCVLYRENFCKGLSSWLCSHGLLYGKEDVGQSCETRDSLNFLIFNDFILLMLEGLGCLNRWPYWSFSTLMMSSDAGRDGMFLP